MNSQSNEATRQSPSELCAPRAYSKTRRMFWIALVFISASLIFCLLDLKAFIRLERFAYEMRMKVRSTRSAEAAQAARQKIVLVTLSDESLASGELPPGYPLPRYCHAKIVRELTRAGARAIVFDLIFAGEKPSEDAELASAARESGKVVWACLPHRKDEWGVEQLLAPSELLLGGSSRLGHCLVSLDSELSTSDRIDLEIECDGQRLPALCLAAVAVSRGWYDGQIEAVQGGAEIGDLFVQLEDGCFRISYFGVPGQTFAAIPYEQIYKGAARDDFYAENRFFEDKIILVGDITARSKERLDTPIGGMNGVEVHAHAIATLLQQRFVRQVPSWINFGAVFLLVLLVCLAASFGNVFRVAAVAAALLFVFFLFNVWLFSERGIWLHMAAPMAAAIACAAALLGERAVGEEMDKKRMRWMLRRYVSPEVAEYIVANPDACALGGKRVKATVLFADIQSFGPMSEDLSSEAVVEILNDYFDAMTAVAFKHGGTVDKFVGDEIMVLFGVPVACADHPRRAVAAALDMQSAMSDLKQRWLSKGLPAPNVCIGVNTGDMVAGSIGSAHRMDFTVIGDDVNAASRVTDFNKQTNTSLLVTESTYEAVKDEVAAKGPLKGLVKEKALVAYEIIRWKEDAGSPRDDETADRPAEH